MKNLTLLLIFLFPILLFSQTNKSINRVYLNETMVRPGIVPTLNGLYYETIFKHEKNLKRAKGSDIVFVKIKTFYIDGSAVEEKEAKINLEKLQANRNTAKLRQGIKKMCIGDKYRFFISQKIDYDRELYVHVTNPLIKVYEVELMDILKKDGTSKHPKQTARYAAVTTDDKFNTILIYNKAIQKAFVKEERKRIRQEQWSQADEVYWGLIDILDLIDELKN